MRRYLLAALVALATLALVALGVEEFLLSHFLIALWRALRYLH